MNKRDAPRTAEPVVHLSKDEALAIGAGTHGDPFSVLGIHPCGKGFLARTFLPDATEVTALSFDETVVGKLEQGHAPGLFEGLVSVSERQLLKYRARNGAHEWVLIDPYCFAPVLGPMDDYYIAEGSHLRLFDKLGAHPLNHQGVDGVHFAVWAPNARRVSVVGDFNVWDGRRNAMRLRNDTGIWEIFIPGVTTGQAYKFEIIGANGRSQPLKADPFARRTELRPKTASVTTPRIEREWGDDAHRAHWSSVDARRQPMTIYEVHPGSWRRHDDGGFLSWDQLADHLIPYCVEMGFTHIEFMPVSEHPYDPSWGYQTTGLYAPSARFGEPEGFARFVDGAHRAGVGVFIDWVPAHFPVDQHGLVRFDGTSLYEHEDPRQGFHPDWNTAIYNFGRKEVVSFLINNALFWAEEYHVDGLRVDAVASMLYLDYSRKDGEWIPNKDGGRENLESVHFLREMNKAVYGSHAGIVTIAEESTSWPKVSAPVHEGGLGFGFKWNMGFMNDTLTYFSREPIHRGHHHDEITFGLVYAFSENFVLPISHDEVVHGKKSMLKKMPGDEWQKFANLRAYYGFMWGYPGKKLLFMGQEFGQRGEWSEARSLDWDHLDDPRHHGMQLLVRDLNKLYCSQPALHARDCEPEGFEWLVADDAANSVFVWMRKAPGHPPVIVICNLTPVPRSNYRINLPKGGDWREIFNSDSTYYGGSGQGNSGKVPAQENPAGGFFAELNLPPLSTLMITPQ